ncbi:MAG: Adaptive-response sensory-kinase SasA [Candidatus Scalindua arabica]|uniref:histidine kinase n=1 Tax=Candidatus Scalindua arabica TaxID=1127984 RepID=A0A941ZYA0_9BACT|nr:Adaptive-response sensory-kinase SasA [Candidatus Scalindua arabica]
MSTDTPVPERSSVEEELIKRVLWFITLRWITVAGICATSLIACFILNIGMPLIPILIIAAGILLFNFVCITYHHYIKCISYSQYIKSHHQFANLQIFTDWIALVFLVHYTGGIESPVIFYFIFHVIIAAILLSRKACYLQTSFAVLLIISLSILEYLNIIPHVQNKELFPNPIYDNSLYLLSILFFCVTSLYVSAYLATSITNQIRKREKEIVVLKDNITHAYHALEMKDREKSEFTYKVTHELRSPLSAIQSLLKSIEEGYAGEISEKAKELIIRSEKRTGFLLTLVKDLLDLVTGKIGKPRESNSKSVDINEAVKSTLHLMQEKVKEKNIKLTVNTTEKPAYLEIIPDDLDIIMTNLIGNAIKYIKEGGTININNIIADNEIRIEISDTGIGIHKDDINKIFEEFYRSNNAKAIESDGTGLGLAIVRNLIKRYDGHIDVQSTFEKGTTVTVTFPV